jgi:2-polyprenyl-3-methyl-5-hydroxy-6-metoxy-1,4-benzoquinol methylase
MSGAHAHNQPRDYYYRAYFEGRGLRGVFHRRRVDALVARVPRGASVLDAGCGSGLTSHLLAQRGCPRSITPAGRFEVADLERLELGERFDAVVCSEAIEHFTGAQQERVLDALVRHLGPGGLLVVTFPSRIYFLAEPAWKLYRKLTAPAVTWDDEDLHAAVPLARVRAQLAGHGLTTAAGSMVHGLIGYIEARRPLARR